MPDERVDLKIPGIADERLVRRGRTSELYRATQETFDRDVAVKVFTGAGLRRAALERFHRECDAMGELSSHPNIVTHIMPGHQRKRAYVVTEWLDNGTVADRVGRDGPVPWQEVLDIAAKLCGALETAHRTDIVHGKLKPEDVFVSTYEEPLLGDFRLDHDDESRSGDPYSILIHAAPDVADGAAPTKSDDLYALCSVLYWLASGRSPFDESDDDSLVLVKGRARAVDPAPFGGDVPTEVWGVLRWGLRPDPAERPVSAQDLGRAVQAVQVALGGSATRLHIRPTTPADRALPPPTVPAAALALDYAEPPTRLDDHETDDETSPTIEGQDDQALSPAPVSRTEPRPEPAPPVVVPDPSVILDEVRSLCDRALEVYGNTQHRSRVTALIERLDEPLRVAIAGKVKAGKSTLLNGLVGEELAPTDAGECTKIVTWYEDGLTYRANLHLTDGTSTQTRFSREGGALDVKLEGRDPASVARIVVEWPSSSLTELTLIDTPGIASISTEVSARTESQMLADGQAESEADAVVYLMRHFHPNDVRFLEAFHTEDTVRPNPVNAIGVLSRADELAGGTTDAMEAADRVAERYRNDPQIRTLCQTVVPVAGLLAQAGATLRESDFRLLGRLADLPRDETAILAASADRFCADELVGKVTARDREHLLRHLGLFGVRASIDAIRTGQVTSSRDLASFLIDLSGLNELRSLLMSQFATRREVLKARTALNGLDQLTRRHPVSGTEGAALTYDLERIKTSAHVFDEIALLANLRAGLVAIADSDSSDAERLLGVEGFSPQRRLGLDDHATADEVRAALAAQHQRWKAVENHSIAREVVDAARVLVRTCEGMIDAVQRASGPAA